ncbi:23S rRNA (adenine(2503)-C(2))-methyltransferase RlmN [Lewinella sp. W8]|uniref:23S rRNA (adenine(2503)-C(2))-methyltransferase RlmN n=1 Tax=Lewinella sp. W8 TaxID=2528208 RepID=UPI001067DD07|nr:23S rRNA (adenine(2503)-C(2))-methyltransferase RlmN [Lewinella sp. W8]MTB53381.1 23S rRNA (adenine(2503)-C(2))-methyltransferase RlmN [Lewinella sp. W8]
MSASTATTLTDIRSLSLEELTSALVLMGERPFRAKQVYEWLWKKGARNFDEMTNLSLALREQLKAQFSFPVMTLDKQQRSLDGTIKNRFRLHDGHLIESVLIPVEADDRFTVCVSSQVGCSLTCTFCATGRMKRLRNLTAAEIYDQVFLVNEQCLEVYGKPLTNIVYMGMGEPLLAFNSVLGSIDRITSHTGLHMAPRRLTVSTAGIAKMIKKLADADTKVNLALSLHAADDEKRNEIMPINETNNLEVLMESLEYFYAKTKKRIGYEYITFQDFNDTLEDAERLYQICRRVPSMVNIIEYNPIDNAPFRKSTEHRIDDFATYLRDRGIMVTVRRSRGKDIDAACGQLANKE